MNDGTLRIPAFEDGVTVTVASPNWAQRASRALAGHAEGGRWKLEPDTI